MRNKWGLPEDFDTLALRFGGFVDFDGDFMKGFVSDDQCAQHHASQAAIIRKQALT